MEAGHPHLTRAQPGTQVALRVNKTNQGKISKTGGFTLPELLIVLAIVTLLLAVLVPVVWSARNQAHSATCQNNLRQMGLALNIYTSEWDETFPEAPGDARADSLPPASLQSMIELRGRVAKPSQGTFVRGQLTQSVPSLKPEIFLCPNDDGSKVYGYLLDSVYSEALTSYLWDPSGPGNSIGSRAPTSNQESVNGVALSSLDDPSRARAMQDYGTLWHTQLGPSSKPTPEGEIFAEGLANTLFADGHIGRVPNDVRVRYAATPSQPGSSNAETAQNRPQPLAP